jgi:hypothetical protein
LESQSEADCIQCAEQGKLFWNSLPLRGKVINTTVTDGPATVREYGRRHMCYCWEVGEGREEEALGTGISDRGEVTDGL